MIRISFLTLTEADAVELAGVLHEHGLLMFDTIEEHVDLVWVSGHLERRSLTHLIGFTKALLHSTVERTAMELLGERLVRVWAQPVTALDPKSTKELMERMAKV
ncbi:MAG: hypothetical protein KIT10_01455 [Flavobacteriales bacterium]|nr:hypothetical protein [Flavobacteriales bacterium]